MSKETELISIIERLVKKIKVNFYFDTHYILSELRREYKDEYKRFMVPYLKSSNNTARANARIGKIIKALAGINEEGKSISANETGFGSVATLFKKKKK